MKKDIDIIESMAQARQKITQELAKVIVGQDIVIEQFLVALFAGGHCLIEGVPGLAKTLLISSLAKALDLSFSRIQFTPDLMPSDITGTEILATNRATNQKEFKFLKGPVFANIILADEINRTPPKTQAALLQAMQEYEVTAGTETFLLDKPFLVMATQNPIEQEGTYPLPEAQLDRFMFNIRIDYPSYTEEIKIVEMTTGSVSQEIQAVLHKDNIMQMQAAIRSIPVSEHVIEFAVKLARSTRPQEDGASDICNTLVSWGAGPRASQNLILGAKARAALSGRLTPSIDDVKSVAEIVLQHRIMLSFAAEAEGKNSRGVIRDLINLLK